MNLPICHLDLETYAETNLKQSGVYRYVEDPSFEFLCCMYRFDDGPIDWWLPFEEFEIPDKLLSQIKLYCNLNKKILTIDSECPEALADHIRNGGMIAAHNAEFERTALNSRYAREDLCVPASGPEQYICTAAKAAAAGLPRDLKRACKEAGTEHQKDENGRAAMMALSKPRTNNKEHNRWTPMNSPDKFWTLYTYCDDDVAAESDLDNYLPDLSKYEKRVYILDQKINQRGVQLDVEMVHKTMALRDERKKELEEECMEICGLKPTQTEKLSDWIRANGAKKLPSLQAPDVVSTLKQIDNWVENNPEHDKAEQYKTLRRVLEIRTAHAMKAPSKLDAMLRAVCADDRVHGMFLYHGGSPGRWASRIVQLQNLFRPVIKRPDDAISWMSHQNIEFMRMMYDDQELMKVFASCIRGMLIAAQGHELMCVDFSAIEARIVAWLADSLRLLKIYNTHGMVYEDTAAEMYNLPKDEASLRAMPSDKRFVGKIGTLSLGYEGGWRAYVGMAKNYGVEGITQEVAEDIKLGFREINPEIVSLWRELDAGFKMACLNKGEVVRCSNQRIMFCHQGDWMKMRLPSGRKIHYFKPEIRNDSCTYKGIDTYTRQWRRVDTYGGKLLQNACEGIGRDALVHGAFNAEETGRYPIIGTVHDELLTEPKKGQGSIEELVELVCDKPEWAKGLPINADGFAAHRYRK